MGRERDRKYNYFSGQFICPITILEWYRLREYLKISLDLYARWKSCKSPKTVDMLISKPGTNVLSKMVKLTNFFMPVYGMAEEVNMC